MVNFACDWLIQNTIYDGNDVLPVVIVAILVTDEPIVNQAPGIEVASFAITVYSLLELATRAGMIHETVFVVASIDGVPGNVEDTNSKPFGILSRTTILLAIAAPLLITLILNVTRSFNCCGLDPVNNLFTDNTGNDEKLAEAF
jgi:hypothetical protein